MSDTDNFINEVTEEVRRERLFLYLRRYGWIAVVVVLVIVLGVARSEYRSAQAENKAQAFGDDLLAALENDEAEARATALSALTVEGAAPKAVAGLLEAAELANSDQTEAADAVLTAISGDAEVPEVYRQIAQLKRVLLLGPDMPDADRAAILDALAVPGAPFRPLAQEQLALMAVERADRDAAIEIYQALLVDAESPRDLQQRARQMIVVLGGELDAG